MKHLNNLDLNKNQLLNARLHVLAAAPSSPSSGLIYYDSGTNRAFYYNGSAWVEMSLPLSYKAMLDEATDANTASKIVKRDASGNFSAGSITASLTGTASNASNLNNQAGSFYLARANHTGSQAASTISDFDSQVRANRLDQMAAPTADLSLNSRKITNLADPASDQDAATKAYVDAARSGLDVKQSVRIATTGNISLSGAATLDGIVLANGDRVLVKDQATGSQNGIYTVNTAGAWPRSSDADASAEVTAGMYVFVEEGNTNGDTGWVLTTDNPITLGTTALAFVQFSGAGQITAGAGLAKTGNTLDVQTGSGVTISGDTVVANLDSAGGLELNGSAIRVKLDSNPGLARAAAGLAIALDGGTLNKTATGLKIADSGVGNTQLASGAVSDSKFSGTAGDQLSIAKGGTGAQTAAAARVNLNAAGKYAADIGDGAATAIVITHNLNTRDIAVSVRTVASPYEGVLVDWEATTVNTVTLRFAVAPALNEFRVVIIG